MGVFNVNCNWPNLNRNRLDELYALFNLENMATSETCITKSLGSTIYFFWLINQILFKNVPLQKKVLAIFINLLMLISRLLNEDFILKFFDKFAFLEDLRKVDNPDENYNFWTNAFSEMVERNLSLKIVYVREQNYLH